MIPEHWRRAALAPPAAWGAPLGSGVLRSTPEDFVVDEILGFAAGGEGPHALLHVRKRGANTEWVARELARAAGVKPFEVGFAGLKDRNAVTTQHFTVPRGKRAAEEFTGLKGEGYEVLSAAPHQRKLPRGALEGNRFAISVRGLSCDPAELAQRMQYIATGGSPNYFGEQRFGREAGNLAQVLRTAGRSGRRERRGRDDSGFMLSAARSVIFNGILAERVIGAPGIDSERATSRISTAEAAYSPWTRSTRNSSNAAARSTCIPRRRSPARVSRWPPVRCWRSKRPSRRNFPKRCPSSPPKA